MRSRALPKQLLALLLVPGVSLGQPAAEPSKSLAGHIHEILALVFSPDGKHIISADSGGSIFVWDVSTGKRTHTLGGHVGFVSALAVSPDGRLLASGGKDKLVRIWDLSAGSVVKQFDARQGVVAAMAFSHAGKVLATGGYDRTIRLWSSGSMDLVQTLSAGGGRVTSLAFGQDDKELYSGGVIQESFPTRNGGQVITGIADHIRQWNAKDGKQLRELSVRGSSVVVAPDGHLVLGAGLVPDIQFSPNGAIFMDGYDQVSLVRPDQDTVHRINWRGSAVAISARTPLFATGAGTYFHLEDFGYMAPGGQNFRLTDTRVRIWSLKSSKELLLLPEKQATVIAFSPRDEMLATGNDTGGLNLWDLRPLTQPTK